MTDVKKRAFGHATPRAAGACLSTLWDVLQTYLYQIDQVQEKLLGILLSVRGKLWMALADKGLEHAWGDPVLLRLEYKDKIIFCR